MGQILGKLHQALEKLEACVSDADLLATVRDWALPEAQKALGLSEGVCKGSLDTFA